MRQKNWSFGEKMTDEIVKFEWYPIIKDLTRDHTIDFTPLTVWSTFLEDIMRILSEASGICCILPSFKFTHEKPVIGNIENRVKCILQFFDINIDRRVWVVVNQEALIVFERRLWRQSTIQQHSHSSSACSRLSPDHSQWRSDHRPKINKWNFSYSKKIGVSNFSNF